MRYTPRLYAKAFAADLAAAGNDAERENLLKNLFRILDKRGDTNKAGKIAEISEREYAKLTGKRKVIFETARGINPAPHKRFKHFLRQDDYVEEKIAPGIIAGLRITINGEEQLDETLNRKIEKMLGA